MPRVSDEAIFIALILGIAIFVLIALLAAVVLINHYEYRRNEKFTLGSLVSTITAFLPKSPPKREPSPPADIVATSILEPAPNIESAQIAKPERLPDRIKTLNWLYCFIIATYVAGLNYWHVHFLVGNTSLNIYFLLLSIISPTCFAVVWLRLTGFEWRRALRLFIWVSVTIGGIVLLLPYIGFFLKYYSGHCC